MQRSLSLTAPAWANVGGTQSGLTQANGAPTERTFLDVAATGAQWFYRVWVTP